MNFNNMMLNSIGLIGFKFNSNVSIEAEASVVGAKDKIVVKGLGNTAINHNVGLSHSGVFIKLELPKSGSITPYGRLGVLDSKAKLTLGNGNYQVTDTNLAYGLGINYEWGDNLIFDTNSIRQIDPHHPDSPNTSYLET